MPSAPSATKRLFQNAVDPQTLEDDHSTLVDKNQDIMRPFDEDDEMFYPFDDSFDDMFDSEPETDDSSSSSDMSPSSSDLPNTRSESEQWTREEVLALFRVVLVYMASYTAAQNQENETTGAFRFRRPIPRLKHPLFPDHPIRPLPNLFSDYWQASIQSSVQYVGGNVFIMPPIIPTRGAAPPSIVSTRPPAWAVPHFPPAPPPPPPYNPQVGQDYLNRIRNGEVRTRGRILTIPPRTPPVQKQSLLRSILDTVTESVSVLGKRRQREDDDEEGRPSKKGNLFGLWWS